MPNGGVDLAPGGGLDNGLLLSTEEQDSSKFNIDSRVQCSDVNYGEQPVSDKIL